MSLILSLDTKDIKKAESIVKEIKEDISMIKVGHIIMPYLSYERLDEISLGKDIFLDFKLHDIPNTVFQGIKSYIKNIKNLKFITIHSSSDEMILKALEAKEGTSLEILSVISLTSNLLNKDFFLKEVERNIKLGVQGFICPATILEDIRDNFGKDIILVSPGIRNDSAINDHKEIKSAFFAYEAGASYIVVGRPIMHSNNPKDIVKNYIKK